MNTCMYACSTQGITHTRMWMRIRFMRAGGHGTGASQTACGNRRTRKQRGEAAHHVSTQFRRDPDDKRVSRCKWELPRLACSTQVFERAVSSGMRKAAQMDVVVSPPCVAVVSRLSLRTYR